MTGGYRHRTRSERIREWDRFMLLPAAMLLAFGAIAFAIFIWRHI